MRRRKRWRRWVVLVTVLVVLFFVGSVNPVVFNYARATLEALTVQAVNRGVSDVVTADTYTTLTDIRRDANGTITSINADTLAMNLLAGQVASRAQTYLAQMGQAGIPIPVGTFSGIPILVGRGLPVRMQVNLVGAVNCRFASEFTSAGINQTQHKITLLADAIVDLVLPLRTMRTTVTIEILFADSVIVGQVPEFIWSHTME